MESSRFFVANLPKDVKDSDLRKLFKDYGAIERIDIKTKENLVNPDEIKVIAFITLKIGKDIAEYCVNDLNRKKLYGSVISVSIAKESFLERLKREREETESVITKPKEEHKPEYRSELLNQFTENKRKTFSVDIDLNDEEISADLLITKKRASSSICNGKIVIQSFDSTPVHIIERTKAGKKLDDKSASADQKRKESMKKFKVDYELKKSVIQKSLAESHGSTANKIKFSDAESDIENDIGANSKAPTKLFESDDEKDGNEFELNVKPQLFGKKGEKLIAMQSKQSLDPRFKIDETFVDDNDEVNQVEKEKPNTCDDERNWQIGLIEEVTGTKLDTALHESKASKRKMMRYDPAKDEHRKFERTKDTKIQVKQNETESSENITNSAQVSKEVFYVVKDTLAQSLKMRSEGFSLLNMFGNSHEEMVQRNDQLKKVSNEKILINKVESNNLHLFKYDSSSDSEKEDVAVDGNNTVPKPNDSTETNKKKSIGTKGKVKVIVESFFIHRNDVRLKEGAKFFKYNRDAEQNYDDVRDRLKMLIKNKIVKSKKKSAGSRRKMKTKRNL